MADEKIGLAQFIAQIKRELLEDQPDADGNARVFSVDEVELELSVGATQTGKGGIAIYVLEAGASIETEQLQKVRVKLTPILDRETRLRLLDPALSESERQNIVKATFKGPSQISLDQQP